jgi:hypothetical protein
MAADALCELSDSSNPQGREYQISAELVLGESSGPAPKTSESREQRQSLRSRA